MQPELVEGLLTLMRLGFTLGCISLRGPRALMIPRSIPIAACTPGKRGKGGGGNRTDRSSLFNHTSLFNIVKNAGFQKGHELSIKIPTTNITICTYEIHVRKIYF